LKGSAGAGGSLILRIPAAILTTERVHNKVTTLVNLPLCRHSKRSDFGAEKSSIRCSDRLVTLVTQRGIPLAAVPASQEVTDALAHWRKRSLYAAPTDRVFPSPKMGGKQPYWQDSLMRKVIWPAAKRAGLLPSASVGTRSAVRWRRC
jgi:hypothetical protein